MSMSVSKIRTMAEEAARLARAQGDEATAVLAEAVAELAKQLRAELKNIEAAVKK